MVTAIKMPKLGLSGETSLIGQWVKNKGDRVNIGDTVVTVETDKASFEVEAEAEGVLLDIFYEEGDEVPVLITIGVIGEEGEEYTEFLNAPATNAGTSEVDNSEAIAQTQKESALIESKAIIGDTVNQSVKISPRARKTAERLNLDYRLAIPTGAEERIIEKDVYELLSRAPRLTSAAQRAGISGKTIGVNEASGLGGRLTIQDLSEASSQSTVQLGTEMEGKRGYEVRPFSRMRKVIAKNMMNSLQNSAQLTLTTSFDASSILEFRNKVKRQKGDMGLENISLNDMVLFAVSKTLLNHDELNAHLIEEDLLVFDSVHLGVAVDTPKGLIVPTLFHANSKSLTEIAKTSKELAQKCKDGTILPDEMQGASFTVTNLGSFGIESFTPVLNPPQVGILGVNTISYRMKQVDAETITYPAMGLSLTFDHRAIDGAPAAKFLKDLTNNLEHFELLLAK